MDRRWHERSENKCNGKKIRLLVAGCLRVVRRTAYEQQQMEHRTEEGDPLLKLRSPASACGRAAGSSGIRSSPSAREARIVTPGRSFESYTSKNSGWFWLLWYICCCKLLSRRHFATHFSPLTIFLYEVYFIAYVTSKRRRLTVTKIDYIDNLCFRQ